MKDGGPAFPAIAEGGPNSGLNSEFHYGMSLRDYFAAAALTGFIAKGMVGHEDRAGLSYLQADAMLKERERT